MPGTLAQRRMVDPVLTELARGYSNANFIASTVFPIVPVVKESGKIPQFNKESFKIHNTERAIRARSNRISPDVHSSIDYVLTEHDLEYPIDYRELEEDIMPLKIHATNVVADGIALRHEKMCADLLQNTASYPSGSKITLAGADQFSDPTSDPIVTFDYAKNAVRQKIAKSPNVLVLGAATFNALKNHPSITDKIKFTQHAIVTPELLRNLLGFDKLVIGQAVFENTPGTLSDIWEDFAGLYYVPQVSKEHRSYYEPSFGYTLRKSKNPIIDTYEEAGKVMLIRNTDIFIPKIVGSDAGYLINDCVA